jgi:ribosome recycling factor
MGYNFNQLKDEIKKTEEWLRTEFGSIRTGRAAPAVLDTVKVDAYGSDVPINQVAGISVEDARMIRITPWDMSQAKAIEKGIQVADLGLSVTVDDKGLRVVFPELTTERRGMFLKLGKQKLEDARVALRSEREKVWKDIEKKEKDGEISEDDKFRLKTELQKIVDDGGSKLEEMFSKKEKEISE